MPLLSKLQIRIPGLGLTIVSTLAPTLEIPIPVWIRWIVCAIGVGMIFWPLFEAGWLRAKETRPTWGFILSIAVTATAFSSLVVWHFWLKQASLADTSKNDYWEDASKPLTIEEYFRQYSSGGHGTMTTALTVKIPQGEFKIWLQIFGDAEVNTRGISVLVNDGVYIYDICLFVASHLEELKAYSGRVVFAQRQPGEVPNDKQKSMVTSSTLYIYTDGSLTVRQMSDIQSKIEGSGFNVVFRNFQFLIDQWKPRKIHRLL